MVLVSGLRKLILRCLGIFWTTVFTPQNMEVQLPQEDIGYVHPASFNDALTFTPRRTAILPWTRSTFTLITPSTVPSVSSGNHPAVFWTPLPRCVLFFPFFFPRPSRFSVSRPLSKRRCFPVRFTSESSSPSRHPTPHMPLRISYVYSPIFSYFSSPLVHLSSRPRRPLQPSATHRPPTSMQALFI